MTTNYDEIMVDRVPDDAKLYRASWIKDRPEKFEVLIDTLEGEPWYVKGEEWLEDAKVPPGTWVAARLRGPEDTTAETIEKLHSALQQAARIFSDIMTAPECQDGSSGHNAVKGYRACQEALGLSS